MPWAMRDPSIMTRPGMLFRADSPAPGSDAPGGLGNRSAREAVYTQTREYDGLSRLLRMVDAAGHTWRFAWDFEGNCVQVTDPRGSRTAHVYDGLNRLVQTVID